MTQPASLRSALDGMDRIQWTLSPECAFIRNAIENPDAKPKGYVERWADEINVQGGEFQASIERSKPLMLLCFGAFAYEFGRRALSEEPGLRFDYWRAKSMGVEFRARIERFDISKTNIFPLLHATIARGKFIQSHDYFCTQKGENYFEHVGGQLADVLLAHWQELAIWI
jgi:hypothetical protein